MLNSIMKNTLPRSLKANPCKIIPTDFKKAVELPESHVWTPDYPTADPASHLELQVPTVNLDNPNAAELVRRACEEWGIFHITNHGVPMSLLDEMEHQTRRLFALPEEDKMRTLRSPGELCGYGLARLTEHYPKLMWSEGFTIIGSPLEQARKLWPQDHTEFCEVVEEYLEKIKVTRKRVMALVLSSLGLTQEDMEWAEPKNANDEAQVLQLNSYPVCPDPTRAVGLAPHTDSAIFTLLHQGNVSGLEVLREKIGWVRVQPVEGAFTVNVGDLLHVATNGGFKNALHRVVVNRTHHRVSVAYFYGPPAGAKASPLKKLVRKDRPIYRSFTWQEYLDVKAIHFNNAMDFIRL